MFFTSFLEKEVTNALLSTHKKSQPTKCHDGCISESPVLMVNVVLDKGQDVGHNVVLTPCGHQHQTDPGRLTRIPLVIIVHLLLKSQLIYIEV